MTVDYVCGTRDDLLRRAKLVPWTDDDLTDDVDYQQTEPDEQYFNVHLDMSISDTHGFILCVI